MTFLAPVFLAGAIAVWTVGNLVWKLARTDRRRRILSMDEVKLLLAHEESARLVGDLIDQQIDQPRFNNQRRQPGGFLDR